MHQLDKNTILDNINMHGTAAKKVNFDDEGLFACGTQMKFSLRKAEN